MSDKKEEKKVNKTRQKRKPRKKAVEKLEDKTMTVDNLDIKDIQKAKTLVVEPVKEEVVEPVKEEVVEPVKEEVVEPVKEEVVEPVKEEVVEPVKEEVVEPVKEEVEISNPNMIEDKKLKKYIETAVTNHARTLINSGVMDLNKVELRKFTDDACQQTFYEDTDKAYRFACDCIMRVSSALLM